MISKTLPKDLLDQAHYLAAREPKRPKQASLRRAVSTAYYSVFHLLSSTGAELIAPNLSVDSRYEIQRWFNHNEMKKTCQRFSGAVYPASLSRLADATSPSTDLRLLANSFVELQEARHRADYDLSWNLSRVETLRFLQKAQDASEAWQRIRKSAEANLFILSLFHWKELENPRP